MRHLVVPAVIYTGIAASCAFTSICLGTYAAMWWASVAGRIINQRHAKARAQDPA